MVYAVFLLELFDIDLCYGGMGKKMTSLEKRLAREAKYNREVKEPSYWIGKIKDRHDKLSKEDKTDYTPENFNPGRPW